MFNLFQAQDGLSQTRQHYWGWNSGVKTLGPKPGDQTPKIKPRGSKPEDQTRSALLQSHQQSTHSPFDLVLSFLIPEEHSQNQGYFSQQEH